VSSKRNVLLLDVIVGAGVLELGGEFLDQFVGHKANVRHRVIEVLDEYWENLFTCCLRSYVLG
jgi:hypothetical protein